MKSSLWASASLLAALAPTHAVFAQTETAGASSPVTLEEIIVTAQKRSENLQSVAATVTAITSDTLERQGVKEISDLYKVAPDVSVQTGTFSNINIRGIRASLFAPTVDPPNALHIDGAFNSRFTSLQGLMFDVQRIEVLAGPQGTLYGRNSAGGTVNIITNKPTQTLGGNASLDYGNYNAITAQAAMNIPLSDTLAIRGAFYHNSHDGYVRDQGLDDANQTSGRFSALWKPTDADSVLFTADVQKIGGKGTAGSLITEVLKQPTILTNTTTGAVSVVAAGTPNGVVVPILTGTDAHHLAAQSGSADLNQQNTHASGLMGQYDHDFGWATLTAQASFRKTDTHNTSGSISGLAQDPRLVTAGVIRPAARGFLDANSNWNTQEVRLTSPSGQELTWVVGAYRFQEKSTDNHNGSYAVLYPNVTGTIGQVTYTDPLTISSDIANTLNKADAYAGFGQVVYSPSFVPGLHLTGGIRYNTEDKEGSGYQTTGGATNPLSVFNNSKKSWDSTTYKANIAYDITPDNKVYVDYSTGFKSGGFAFGRTPGYDPETIKAYEIGSKNQFFNNTLRVNFSAWHYDYRNMISTALEYYFDPNLNRPNGALASVNAPKAKYDGQSITVDWLPTQNDTINVSVTHAKGKYTQFDLRDRYVLAIQNNLIAGATLDIFDYSGVQQQLTPDFSGNLSYDHVFNVANGTLDLQLATHYTGERTSAIVSPKQFNNYFVLPDYHTEDISLRYQQTGSEWSISGYVRNVLDDDTPTSVGYTSNLAAAAPIDYTDSRVTYAYRTATYGPPRTFGVIFSTKF